MNNANEELRATWEVKEVDPRFYGPDLGKSYFRPGSFQFFPPDEIVSRVTKEAIRRKLKPTNDEALRRQYESELPNTDDNQSLIFLPKHTSPPQATTLQQSRPRRVLKMMGFGRTSPPPFAPAVPKPIHNYNSISRTHSNISEEQPSPKRPVRTTDGEDGHQPYRIPLTFAKASSHDINRTWKVNQEGRIGLLQQSDNGREYENKAYAKPPIRMYHPVPGATGPGAPDPNMKVRPDVHDWEYVNDDEEEGYKLNMGHVTQARTVGGKIAANKQKPKEVGIGTTSRYVEREKSERSESKNHKDGRQRGGDRELETSINYNGTRSSYRHQGSGRSHSDLETRRGEKHDRYGQSRGNDTSSSYPRSETSHRGTGSGKGEDSSQRYGRGQASGMASSYQDPTFSSGPSGTASKHQTSASSYKHEAPERSSRIGNEKPHASDISSRHVGSATSHRAIETSSSSQGYTSSQIHRQVDASQENRREQQQSHSGRGGSSDKGSRSSGSTTSNRQDETSSRY